MHPLRDQVLVFDPAVPIEEGSTPPASWYLDPAFDALEREAVFRRTWQPVCRTDQVADPGAYVAGRSYGLPWVVVRDEGGTLHGLANVCRHKATEVCDGEGVTDELVCPYHGWAYALDGTLRRAPRVAGIRGFDRAALSLPRLEVATWGPYVFLRAEPGPPLAQQVAPLDRLLAPTGWDRLRFHSRRSWDIACNWKVFCDNYLDGGYHVAHVHPGLAGQLDLAGYRTELFDRANAQTCPPAPGAARTGGGAVYAWSYPNFMLNRYGPVLDTNLVLPVDAGRCRVVFDFFFDPEAADERFVQESLASSAATQDEDLWVSERVQVGMASGTWERGRYAPRVETALHHFHRLLAADLRAAT